MFNKDPKLRAEGEEIKYSENRMSEYIRCKEDIIYFAEKYFYIIDPDKGRVKIQLYEFQKRMLKAFLGEEEDSKRHAICLSSRQIGKCVAKGTKIKIHNPDDGSIEKVNIEDLYIKLKIEGKYKNSPINNDKFIDSVNLNEDIFIDSDTGFKKITHIHKTKKYDVWKLKTETCYLECADEHLVYDSNNNEKYVFELKKGDLIKTRKGLEEVIEITKSEQNDNMFDITVDSDTHRYYTNDILSHNTTISTLYMVWYALFNEEKNIAILANKEKTAMGIMRRIGLAYKELPLWLQQGIVEWNKSSIVLENGTRLEAASTASTGIRGDTINCVTGDTKITIKNKETEEIQTCLFNNLKMDLEREKSKQDKKVDIDKLSGSSYDIFLKNSMYEVLTDDGFQDFDGLLINSNDDEYETSMGNDHLLKFTFENYIELKCTPDHKLYKLNGDCVKAKDLNVGDPVTYEYEGVSCRVLKKQKIAKEPVYDLFEVANGHKYYTNGVLSHNCLFLDEFAFVPSNIADDFMASVYPTIIKAMKSKIIIVSTPNGLNHFYHIYKNAVNNNNNFTPIKINWDEVPGRDEKWKEEVIRDIGMIRWNQEFAARFIGSSTTLIDSALLERMGNRCEDPIRLSMGDALKIYEQPQKNAFYILGVDSGKGIGSDYSVIQVLKINDEHDIEHVAMYRSNTINPYEFAQICISTAEFYNKAYIMAENNDVGAQVCDYIWWEFEFENLLNCQKNGLGVHSNKKTKLAGHMLMKRYFENGWITTKDEKTVFELSVYEEVRPDIFKAGGTNHDDCVLALMWGLYFITTTFFDGKKIEIKNIDSKFKIDTEEIENSQPVLPFEENMVDEHGFNWNNMDDGVGDDEFVI